VRFIVTAPDIISQFEKYILHSFSQHGLPVDRCSQIIFSQLAHMPNYGWGVNYPFEFVEQEIRNLEGLGRTSTRPATPFTGKLCGFMHKHFLVPGYDHLGINTILAWKLADPKSRKFQQMALRVAKQYQNVTSTADEFRKFSWELAHDTVYGPDGLMNRLSGDATGDWIVYASHEEKNYYLCIAKHDEDEFILHTIKRCASQFPFIMDILTQRRVCWPLST
jgi:hypothetical protein